LSDNPTFRPLLGKYFRSLPSGGVEGHEAAVLRYVSKLARSVENPTVVGPASVCRIRFQDNLTGIGRPSHRKRGTALGFSQMQPALLNVDFHVRATPLEIEHVNE
jgi:hypothetical protein